jgi:hypothetical protein
MAEKKETKEGESNERYWVPEKKRENRANENKSDEGKSEEKLKIIEEKVRNWMGSRKKYSKIMLKLERNLKRRECERRN